MKNHEKFNGWEEMVKEISKTIISAIKILVLSMNKCQKNCISNNKLTFTEYQRNIPSKILQKKF